jgi:protein-S-isoprenylcysteine O-methyltransferase Ste14
MNRKQVLPPTYFWGSVLLMFGLHYLVPVRKLIGAPYSYLGVIPLLIGLMVNVWCSEQFKRVKTTVKPFEQSSHLVTEGPYRFSRHPMYVGMALALIGLAVLLGTTVQVVVIPIFVWVMGKKFIAAEEKALEETFGEAYRQYSKRVRRWV